MIKAIYGLFLNKSTISIQIIKFKKRKSEQPVKSHIGMTSIDNKS